MVHTAFKTVSNAIELAMIASSTALMQACKREAPPAGVVSLTELFSQRLSVQASGLQCRSYRSTNACVAVNCVRCGRLTMVAGSATSGTGMRAFNSLDRDQVCIIEMFSRGSGRAACVSCVEVLCRAGLNTRLHKL